MKIAIVGYSGSGKSTLAGKLGKLYMYDVLHLDSIHFSSGWKERSDEDMITDVKAFLDKENWIIEGNYSRILYQRRMEEADRIVVMNFNRFSCLVRAYKRYRMYKGKTRPDMAPGCSEKFDREFVLWILRDGRNKTMKKRYRDVMQRYPDKTVVLKNQRQMDDFVSTLESLNVL
ncbi:MAG: DNA topology modulation protein [Erysipelotrichaceae bacterium]|nr:DNA topology modulation protein [Erysipelotrichaceae bacterium]